MSALPCPTRRLALLAPLLCAGCLPALGLPGPPDAVSSAMAGAGARIPDATPRLSYAQARLVGAAAPDPVWGGQGRALLIGQLGWDGDHPGLPAGDHQANVAFDPRVGAGVTVGWAHLRLHGELTGWVYPIVTDAGVGGSATGGGAASASTVWGPVELFLAGDAAAGGWYARELTGGRSQDREVASAVAGLALHAGPACLYLEGGPSRVAQHGAQSDNASHDFKWAQSAWVGALGVRLEADPQGP